MEVNPGKAMQVLEIMDGQQGDEQSYLYYKALVDDGDLFTNSVLSGTAGEITLFEETLGNILKNTLPGSDIINPLLL